MLKNKVFIFGLMVVVGAGVILVLVFQSRSTISPPNFNQAGLTCTTIENQQTASIIHHKLEVILKIDSDALEVEVDKLVSKAYICSFQDMIYYAVEKPTFIDSLRRSRDEIVSLNGQQMTIGQACSHHLYSRIIAHLLNPYVFGSVDYVITINPLILGNDLRLSDVHLSNLKAAFRATEFAVETVSLCS